MSTKAKVALGTAVVTAAAMISYVHLKQEWERERLHQGVIKDKERQRLRKSQKEQVALEQNKNNTL